MSKIEEKEVNVLTKINRTINELELTLEKMDETESKINYFYEQEKAIHEIRVIIRKAKKVAKLVDKEVTRDVDEVVYATEDELTLAQEIDEEFNKLDQTLTNMNETDGKAKSYLEQQKALHEAKKILKKAEKLEQK
ncbi:hypothetical protein [Enterococcus sp. AZ072]|uniref:hypothetical protein n=1 Tax=unclassified Enterococcus TaxID=2608891 RepID=UPI003D2BB556